MIPDLEATTWCALWFGFVAAAMVAPQAIADFLEGRRARLAREIRGRR